MTREEKILVCNNFCVNAGPCGNCAAKDVTQSGADCNFDDFSDSLLDKYIEAFTFKNNDGIPETDPVHPNHYMLPGGMQVIDVEVAMFGREWVMHHCICTAVEYLLRHRQKNGDEDVKKAKWWIEEWAKLKEDDEDDA